MSKELVFDFLSYVDPTKPSFQLCIASCIFNPLFWNIIARQEFHKKILTKLFGGPYTGCYALAVTIFSLGILRDYLYREALLEQPSHPLLKDPILQLYGSYACLGLGSIFVLSSMWALGVTGTYLGDYFGILMDSKVESFPFNVTNNPMYYGSTLNFLGTALRYASPSGILISLFVFVLYKIALRFEEPFTIGIYEAREKERQKRQQ
ncbi:phospholipid methyltransferase [Atractiella rhizophila]|nr:phospholipid methyltransferase [Atractiella rhizophila]